MLIDVQNVFHTSSITNRCFCSFTLISFKWIYIIYRQSDGTANKRVQIGNEKFKLKYLDTSSLNASICFLGLLMV